SMKAAGLLTEMKRQIERTRKAVEAARASGGKVNGLELNAALAGRAAETTAGLRAALKNWFTFYDGYDPVFTWWMGLPYKEADQALQSYTALLREKVGGEASKDKGVPASQEGVAAAAGPDRPAPPAAAPAPAKESEVPDLRELVARPRSEMAAVIQ